MNKKQIFSTVEQVIDLYNMGVTQREIAIEINVPSEAISGFLKTIGISTKPRLKTKKRIEKIKEMANRGVPIVEIAKTIGVAYPTICWYKKKFGIETVRKTEASRIKRHTKECIEMYKSGSTMQECGNKFGVTKSCVSLWFINAGVNYKDLRK